MLTNIVPAADIARTTYVFHGMHSRSSYTIVFSQLLDKLTYWTVNNGLLTRSVCHTYNLGVIHTLSDAQYRWRMCHHHSTFLPRALHSSQLTRKPQLLAMPYNMIYLAFHLLLSKRTCLHSSPGFTLYISHLLASDQSTQTLSSPRTYPYPSYDCMCYGTHKAVVLG